MKIDKKQSLFALNKWSKIIIAVSFLFVSGYLIIDFINQKRLPDEKEIAGYLKNITYFARANFIAEVKKQVENNGEDIEVSPYLLWSDLTQTKYYQSLIPEEKEKIKNRYWYEYIEQSFSYQNRLTPEGKKDAKNQFFSDTEIFCESLLYLSLILERGSIFDQ